MTPTADDFRSALTALFGEAQRDGARSLVVRAGDLHERVGGYPGTNHRMPVCCATMRAMMGAGDAIVAQPPKGAGASLTIAYALPR